MKIQMLCLKMIVKQRFAYYYFAKQGFYSPFLRTWFGLPVSITTSNLSYKGFYFLFEFISLKNLVIKQNLVAKFVPKALFILNTWLCTKEHIKQHIHPNEINWNGFENSHSQNSQNILTYCFQKQSSRGIL